MSPEPNRTTRRIALWRRLWRPADPILVDAGAGGELLVARIRVLLTCMLVVIPVGNILRGPAIQENIVGLGIGVGAVGIALLILQLTRRELYRPWLGFVTSAVDVSTVSFALVLFLVLDAPHTAVNSKVVFEVYFLAIFATSLRYDARVCITTGFLALIQYGAIAAYADWRWDLNDPAFAPFPYGMFSWNAQAARLIILLAAGVLSTAIVLRTQRLRQLSASDRLTGLLNRGYFDARLGAELSRAQRSGQPVAVAMLDVDHFKRFNDQRGHAAGDAALRAIAALLRHAVRRSDIVARYGGEEFVLVFPETSAEAAVERLEGIRRSVAEATIRLPRNQTVTGLSVSAGVAAFPADGVETADLVELADRRLFQAKAGGRNRVVGPKSAAGQLSIWPTLP